jgi:hypothetical protein
LRKELRKWPVDVKGMEAGEGIWGITVAPVDAAAGVIMETAAVAGPISMRALLSGPGMRRWLGWRVGWKSCRSKSAPSRNVSLC